MSSEEHPLEAELKSVSAEQLEKTREIVQEEIDSSKEKGATLPSGVEVEDATDEEEPVSSRDSQTEFVADLNNVADLLVILVGRYEKVSGSLADLVKRNRRTSGLLIACIVLLAGCIGILVKAGFEIDYLQRGQSLLQAEVTRATEELRLAKVEVKKIGVEVDEATDEVKETKKEVQEAASAAPKIEVGADGKAQVVIPVKRPDKEKPKGDKKDDKPAPSSSSTKPAPKSPPPPPPSAGKKVPLNPQIGIKDDF
jgi:hypothetical protein